MTHFGDTKSYKGGGGGYYYNPDADDRAHSKTFLIEVQDADNALAYLLNLSDLDLFELWCATNRITNYGYYDWERIVKLLPEGQLEILLEKKECGRDERVRKDEAQRKARAERDKVYTKQRAIARAAEKRDEQEKSERMVDESRLISGHLHSEIAEAIRRREKYGRYDGEWLDDPVAAITGQGGFGEEVIQTRGIKLEVNIALDCSNSMIHNKLTEPAKEAMRTIYLALDLAAKQLPDGTLTIAPWLWAKGDDGKRVVNMARDSWSDRMIEVNDDNPLGPMKSLGEKGDYYLFTGEDTWIHPLLEAINKNEQRHGDPGAFRLDIILTDGVLDHKTDSRKGNNIQDERNGNLQTVVLNFLPMEDWGNYPVPNRCVQYEATTENVSNLMRQVLGDWVVGAI